MGRYFNTEGQCEPDIHYMVRLDDRLDKIKRLYVDREKYFVINRGRQYGKTTTLYALEEYLKKDYLVVSLDFQRISTIEYRDELIFTKAFLKLFVETLEENGTDADEVRQAVILMKEAKQVTLSEMFSLLSDFCKASTKPVVLMIDEVDSASNNQVFIDFLAQLRGYYLRRRKRAIFRSVILAGVYDIKNLKLKIRPDSEHQYNSPWNIAAVFDIDMSFSAGQIRNMLEEYEADNKTEMDEEAVAEEIYQYTSGYPYLVSAICKILDEKLPECENFADKRSIWSREGIAEAVRIILSEKLPLFDSLIKQLDTYKDLRNLIEEILYQGKKIPFNPYIKSVNLGLMFGYLKEDDRHIIVANRIFEMSLMNMLIAEESLKSDAFRHGEQDKNQFIRDGRLDMEREWMWRQSELY